MFLERLERPVLAAIAGEHRGVLRLLAGDFLVNGSDCDPSLGGRKGQIFDEELGPILVVEVLHLPAFSQGYRRQQSKEKRRESHLRRAGVITRSMTLTDASDAGSTHASATRQPTCSPTVVSSSISPPV